MNICKKFAWALVACLIFAQNLSPLAFADAAIDPTADASITVEYQYNEAPISHADFDFFQVGTYDAATNTYALTGAFENAEVDLNTLDYSEDLQAAASYLEHYVDLHALTIDYCMTTQDDGTFLLDNVAQGVYLVVCDHCLKEHTEGYQMFCADPVLVFVPEYDHSATAWEYDVTVQPKVNMLSLDEDFDFTLLRVAKFWVGDTEADRPEAIEVQIYCDGEAYMCVTLSAENDWQYEWSSLDTQAVWAVEELDVPETYTVMYSKCSDETVETIFEITNTFIVKKPSPTPTTTTEIVQTGVITWPITVFGAAGCIFLLLGLFFKKREE